eukprot:GHVS01049637.1.p1 GENE.GHVS01049637.1~~GHVS01049637.1.p1  ORF type:complete len:461 (-),score=69.67 GHVS01049637.1:123-1505(-)
MNLRILPALWGIAVLLACEKAHCMHNGRPEEPALSVTNRDGSQVTRAMLEGAMAAALRGDREPMALSVTNRDGSQVTRAMLEGAMAAALRGDREPMIGATTHDPLEMAMGATMNPEEMLREGEIDRMIWTSVTNRDGSLMRNATYASKAQDILDAIMAKELDAEKLDAELARNKETAARLGARIVNKGGASAMNEQEELRGMQLLAEQKKLMNRIRANEEELAQLRARIVKKEQERLDAETHNPREALSMNPEEMLRAIMAKQLLMEKLDAEMRANEEELKALDARIDKAGGPSAMNAEDRTVGLQLLPEKKKLEAELTIQADQLLMMIEKLRAQDTVETGATTQETVEQLLMRLTIQARVVRNKANVKELNARIAKAGGPSAMNAQDTTDAEQLLAEKDQLLMEMEKLRAQDTVEMEAQDILDTGATGAQDTLEQLLMRLALEASALRHSLQEQQTRHP